MIPLVLARWLDQVDRFASSMRGRADRSRSVFAPAMLFVALLLLSSCASAPPQAVPPGPFEPLAEDEGFLVVQIDTTYGIERIDVGRIPIARDLQAGEYLWLVRVKAGRYGWKAIRLAAQTTGSSTLRLRPVSATKEQEFEFTVEPGQVNYPGHLVIGSAYQGSAIYSGVEIRSRNHSAMAVRKLLRSHAELMAAHPIRYGGTSDDGFLDFYTNERDRLGRTAPRAATATEASR